MTPTHGFRIFLGKQTKQRDKDGNKAKPEAWYVEPFYHDSEELWSGPFDTAEEAGASIDSIADEDGE